MIIIYFIPLQFFLPFSLKIRHKIILFIIIGFHLMVLYPNTGNLCIISLLVCVSLYLSSLDSHKLQTVCIFLGSYLLIVVLDYFLSSIWDYFGYTISRRQSNPLLYFLSTLILVSCLFCICHILSWFLKQNFQPFKKYFFIKEIWYFVFFTLLLCTIIFVINIIIGETLSYPQEVIHTNFFLFGCYFLLNIIFIIFLFRSYIRKTELKAKQDAYNTLQNYTKQIELMYSDITSFKHDYNNIMLSLAGYIQEKDLDGLQSYFENHILPLKTNLHIDDCRIYQLSNILLPDIKNLIMAKVIFAHETGIDINIEILFPIKDVFIDRIDFCRVIGVFLDNAIESARETSNPHIDIVLIEEGEKLTVLIRNNFIPSDIPYSKLKKSSTTTKSGHLGIGLSNVHKILSKYENVFLSTDLSEHIFTQQLELLKKLH